MLQLYTYFRSSAAYRVRIALNLKGLPYASIPVHLVRHGGEQHGADFARINPAHLVPALVDGEDTLSQSMAIIEYLEETHPTPALLPLDAAGRARVRALAQAVACEIHPLNNLRVLRYLAQELKVDEAAKIKWIQHWITLGFTAFEAQLAHSASTGEFCHGATPTLADCCLIPQIYNARRFDTPLEAFPHLLRIEANCLALEAFAQARPEAQPDAA
ncbi:MAG: maleylacetoacetate isomerase [Rhodoferax sp.]|uniref:maleylacetoacetate isomerase n=1 Tax=Rhodoferax sp. TaxID=50421 RepID=UPI00301607C1